MNVDQHSRPTDADLSVDGASSLNAEPSVPRGPSFVLAGFLIIGGFIALLFATSRPARAAWHEVAGWFSLQGEPVKTSASVLSEHEMEALDSMQPQAQAELLLERSINHFSGATDQIASRVASWTGKLNIEKGRLRELFMTALNSDDLRVRVAAVEVDIAARKLEKTPFTIDRLENAARFGEQGPRANALWDIALVGNRGIQQDRALEILLSSIHDTNVNIRYWAVEGLAYLGTDGTVAPLLQVFHDDPSPMIRERAACGLAQSGMLSERQRRKAVPRLLDFVDDPALDAETQKWVYQALRDITGQSLPHNAAAWRTWYASNSDGQWNPVTRDER